MPILGEFQSIAIDEKDGVVWLLFNRPDKLNALTSQMHQEIRDVLAQIQQQPEVRCLVLSGTGRAFSAGQDLADLDLKALGEVVENDYNPLVKTLTQLHIPVIACVNGVAAGAAANLALACDIVIAAKSARFIQSFQQIGLVPDSGGTWTLPKLVGLARATALCLTGEAVNADQAETWGMIWKSVDDAELTTITENLAKQLASGATVGLAYTKQLLRLSQTRSLEDQLNLERDYQQAASQSNDFSEGVEAFLAKRTPVFKGN